MKVSNGAGKFLAAVISQLLIINSAWAAGPGAFSGRVVEVMDGTTIKVRADGGDRLVRLAGLEAESATTEMGRKAKAVLERELLGKTVMVESVGAYPTENKALAGARHDVSGAGLAPVDGKVTLDGKDIALILVGAGLAWLLYNILNDMDRQNRQEEAKKRQYGVWSQPSSRGRSVSTFAPPATGETPVSSGQSAYGESVKGGYGAAGTQAGSAEEKVTGQAGASTATQSYTGSSQAQDSRTHGKKIREEKDNPGLHKGWEKQKQKGNWKEVK